MSYVSPIKIGYTAEPEEGWIDKIGKYMAGEVDNLVLQSCVKVGCHVDKDELEKALRYDRGQYEKGYEDGKRDAASPWHRVEERLPEPHEYVLCCGKKGGCFVGWTLDNADVIKANGHGRAFVHGGNARTFTHWMPIPEPPKEEE